MTKSVYFYPSTSGNGSATTDLNKAFGSVGSGRVEIINTSPRCQKETHQVYLNIEHVSGVAIEAPLKLILRNSNPDHEIVLLKTLDFLNTMVENEEFDFLLGGMRTQGYGRAKVLPLIPKKAKSTKNKENDLGSSEKEGDESVEEEEKNYKIQFTLKKADAAELEEKFLQIVKKEKEKFPFSIEIKTDDKPEKVEE